MTNSTKLVVAVLFFIFAIPDRANAQITITYDATYPKAGTNKGDIAVSGKINIPAGTVGQTAGTGSIVIVPSGGGRESTFPITIAANQTGNVAWSGTASMLGGPNYNVTVKIDVKLTMTTTVRYATDTKVAAPK